MDFRDKRVVVTGASAGIGRAAAVAFAAQGARLALVARSREGLAETARLAGQTDALVLPADLTRMDDIARLCGEIRARFGRLDVLVNNAGVGLYAPSYRAEPETVRRMFELNVLAPVELVRLLLPAMPRGSAIVNVSSIVGKVPLPWLTLYSASKFALNAYSDGLRMELTGSGVAVVAVCPGYVDTGFSTNVLEGRLPDNVAGNRRFKISAEQCAAAIVEGVRKRKRTVVVPAAPGWLFAAAARLLPGPLYAHLARLNPEGRYVRERE